MARKKKRSKTSHRSKPRRTVPIGVAPGHLPDDDAGATPELYQFHYGPDELIEGPCATAGDLGSGDEEHPISWINVTGVSHRSTLRELGTKYGLHPLALEDCVNVRQRPKVENYGDHLFIVIRMPSLTGGLELEQIGIFLLPGVVITIQEHAGDCFEHVRKRLRANIGRIRKHKADYLAYALIDAIVDHYYPVLEHYGDALEVVESKLMASTSSNQNISIHAIKQDLSRLRRALWPLRETLSTMFRDDDGHFEADTRTYLRDCHDHAMQLLDLVEASREMGSSLMDLHLSSLSQRMNEVMKMLTLIATIFIPLGFIAGVYGMNFHADNPWSMPELSWAYGYPFALGLMLTTALAFIWYFRRRGWLGQTEGDEANGD